MHYQEPVREAAQIGEGSLPAQRAVAREFETAAAEQGGVGSIEFAEAAIDRLAAALGEGIQRPVRA